MIRCMRLLCASIVLTSTMLGATVSCTSTDRVACRTNEGAPSDVLQQRKLAEMAASVLVLWDERMSASAVQISSTQVITARHVPPEFVFMRELVVDGKVYTNPQPRFEAHLAQRAVSMSVLSSGETTEARADWVVLGAEPSVPLTSPPIFDAHHVFVKGEEVILIGYPDAEVAALKKGATYSPSFVRVRVCDAPLPWLDVPPELVCVKAPQQKLYAGLSGGAAVVWDNERRCYVVVGIYHGLRVWSALGLSAQTHTIVRLPAAEFDRLQEVAAGSVSQNEAFAR